MGMRPLYILEVNLASLTFKVGREGDDFPLDIRKGRSLALRIYEMSALLKACIRGREGIGLCNALAPRLGEWTQPRAFCLVTPACMMYGRFGRRVIAIHSRPRCIKNPHRDCQ